MIDAGLRPEWKHYVSEVLDRLYTLFGVTDPALRQFFEDVFDDDGFCAACFRSNAIEHGEAPTRNEPLPFHTMVVVALEAQQAPNLHPQDRQLAAVAGFFYWCGFVYCADPRNRFGTVSEDISEENISLARALFVTAGLLRLEQHDECLAGTLSRLFGAGERGPCDRPLLHRLETAIRDHAPDLRALWTWDF